MSFPPILLGNARVAARRPDAIVIDPRLRQVHNCTRAYDLTLQQYRLLVAVLVFRGEPRRAVDLVELVYGERRDGGPLGTYESMRSSAVLLNRKLIGLRICWGDRRGFRAVLA